MKKTILALVLLAMMLAVVWFFLSLPAEVKYEQVRRMSSQTYQIIPIDQPFAIFLSEVQSNWACKADVTNGPDSDVVKLAGMTPSVRNLIYVFNYQMPPYQWFSPSQNKKSAAINLIKVKFMPISVDQRWYISDDGHFAALHCKTNVVYIYRDASNGIRATLYVKRKNDGQSSNLPSARKE